MSTRTVRLDEETENALQQIMQETGLSISAVFKKGLLVLRNEVAQQIQRVPYDLYRKLDLGPGGYATGPSTQTSRAVRAAVQRKLRR